MALASTVVDSFNDGTAASFWAPFGVYSEAGGELRLSSTAGTTNYAGYETSAGYDLTGNYVLARLLTAGNQALTSWQCKPCEVKIDANNTLAFYVNNGNIVLQKQVATVYADVRADTAYSASAHRWFRIRESGGTTYADYSADGVDWTNYTSLANPFAMTNLILEMSAGTYNAEGSGTFAIMDSFNILPTGTPRIKAGNGMSVTGSRAS